MISPAVDYGVAFPERPRSWFTRRERQAPVRDAIVEAKVHAAWRRLYRRFFEPLVLATKDRETREHDARLFWETTAPLTEHLVANMMGGRSDG